MNIIEFIGVLGTLVIMLYINIMWGKIGNVDKKDIDSIIRKTERRLHRNYRRKLARIEARKERRDNKLKINWRYGKLGNNKTPSNCPVCNNKIGEDDNYCMNCGSFAR